MRLLPSLLCIGAAVSQLNVCLHSAPVEPDSGNGPAAVLAKAWPFYDFTSTNVKPWHLKATYLLYDANGKHPQTGVYEYWWASPNQSRSTWMRAGMSHTDWHLANGHLAYKSSGSPLSLFEYKLEAALIAPLPRARDLDPAKFRLDRDGATRDGVSGEGAKTEGAAAEVKTGRESCLTIVPVDEAGGPTPGATEDRAPETAEDEPFPTYCFDVEAPVLRSVYSFERVLMQFSRVRQMQGRFLARRVLISEGDSKLLTARVDVVEPISPSNPALNPPASALKTEVFVSRDVSLKDVELDMEVARRMLIKKTDPAYPVEARKAGIEGKVELEAMIGTDGKIHDLRVISAPAASLAAASFAAVSQWVYRPYLLKGRAVPVQTKMMVTFSLDR